MPAALTFTFQLAPRVNLRNSSSVAGSWGVAGAAGVEDHLVGLVPRGALIGALGLRSRGPVGVAAVALGLLGVELAPLVGVVAAPLRVGRALVVAGVLDGLLAGVVAGGADG